MELAPASAHIWSSLKSAAPPAGQAWLRWHPSQEEECLAARGLALPAPLAAEELGELREAHRRWGADSASLAMIEALGDARARVIVTGQQPDLLAGPLLVLHKTIGAIKLALRLQQAHPELRLIPVFWVASEDHDFDEIRRAFWPGHSGQMEEFLLPQSSWKPGQMVGRIQVDESLGNLIEQVSGTTFRSEFRDAVLETLRQTYAGGADLETGFARLMLRMFAGTGLVLVSPLQAWVRRRAAAVLEREFAAPGRSSAKVIERGEALRAAGLEPSLHRAPGSINAFWVDMESRRYSMRLDGTNGGEILRTLAGNGAARAQASGENEPDNEFVDEPPLQPAALRLMLSSDPKRFSGNVVTRPLIQDSVLPTVAQVIGPGEAAYLAQVEAVYSDFGVFTPLRFPRPQATLLEPRVARNLERHQLSLEEVLSHNAAELTEIVLRRDMDRGDLKDVQDFRAREFADLDALAARFAKPGSGVEGAFRKLRQAMEKGFDTVTERMLYQRQQDEHHLLQAMTMLVSSLHPADLPQERRLNPIVPFALNYGPDWVRELTARLSIDPQAGMQVVNLAELFHAAGTDGSPV